VGLNAKTRMRIVIVAIFAAVGVAIGVTFAYVGLDAGAWKHFAAILAAVLAIALSLGQATNALKKSRDHSNGLQADGKLHQADNTLKEVLKYDIDHFRRVGGWWFVGAGGAVATLIAEILDLI
jgi:hypothetical protein